MAFLAQPDSWDLNTQRLQFDNQSIALNECTLDIEYNNTSVRTSVDTLSTPFLNIQILFRVHPDLNFVSFADEL